MKIINVGSDRTLFCDVQCKFAASALERQSLARLAHLVGGFTENGVCLRQYGTMNGSDSVVSILIGSDGKCPRHRETPAVCNYFYH